MTTISKNVKLISLKRVCYLGLPYIFIEFSISVQCSWSGKFEIQLCLNSRFRNTELKCQIQWRCCRGGLTRLQKQYKSIWPVAKPPLFHPCGPIGKHDSSSVSKFVRMKAVVYGANTCPVDESVIGHGLFCKTNSGVPYQYWGYCVHPFVTCLYSSKSAITMVEYWPK